MAFNFSFTAALSYSLVFSPFLAQWDGARTIWDLHRDQFFYTFHTHPKRCQTNFHQIVILWISSFAFIGFCFSLSITYPSNCPWTMRLRSSNNNSQPSCVSAGKKGKKKSWRRRFSGSSSNRSFFFFFDLDGASGGEVEEAEVRSNKKLMTVSILKHQAFAFITIKNWNLIDLFWCFHWQSLPSTQHTAGSSNNRVENHRCLDWRWWWRTRRSDSKTKNLCMRRIG